MGILLKLIPIGICILVNIAVYLDIYNPILILLWIFSILLILLAPLLAGRKKIDIPFPAIQLNKKSVLIFFILLLPVLVRIAHFNLNRIHTDDLITAYFSATEDFTKINFFSGIPQKQGEWVAQFPTPFFILQNIFFTLFGKSLLSVKLSIQPYVFIISVTLFLLVRKILNEKAAIISVILYAFLPISLYLETLGLHFVSSTAVFMVFFYLAILNIRRNSPLLWVLVGICTGVSFLFYITSFIALPFLFLFFIIQFLLIRKLSVVRNFLLSLLAFCITVSPFFTYAGRYNNYFMSRINQVSFLTGSWSGAKDQLNQGKNIQSVLKEQSLISIESLYRNGIGGHGGYTFSQLALFNTISLSLLIIGSILSLFLISGKIELILVFSVIIASFISGIILSISPPAFHRFSLAFPFIAIVSTVPFYVLFTLGKTKTVIKNIIAFVLIGSYVLLNESYFFQSVKEESYNISLRLSDTINQNYPGRNIYVASFGGYSFMKIYYFSKGKTAKSIQTDYHDNFIKRFNPHEKYVYIIIFPKDFDKIFTDLDPNGKLIKYSDNYSLFMN